MKLVSIIMPTINPEDMLRKALDSIKNTATDYSQVEVLLRVDDNNDGRIRILPDLKDEYGAKCVVGPRGSGYLNMGGFVDDLVGMANSKWCWLFDDDSWVEGDWQTTIQNAPHDVRLRPQIYQLGPSTYENGGCVGISIPTALAKTIKHRNPVDQQWYNLTTALGWQERVMPGVTYFHDGRPR